MNDWQIYYDHEGGEATARIRCTGGRQSEEKATCWCTRLFELIVAKLKVAIVPECPIKEFSKCHLISQ